MARVAHCIALLLWLACPAPAEEPDAPDLFKASVANRDWPMLQHDIGRTGRSLAPAIEKPAIAWRTWVGIAQYDSAPIVVGDRVYIATSGRFDKGGDDFDGLACLHRVTGMPLWRRNVPVDAMGVALAGGRVFFTDVGGFVHAVHPRTGKKFWSADLGESIDGDPLPIFDRLAIGGAAAVYGLGQADGQSRIAPIPVQTSHPPQLCSDGKRLFISRLFRTPLAVEIDAEADSFEVSERAARNYELPVIARNDTVVFPFDSDWPWREPQLLGSRTFPLKMLYGEPDRTASDEDKAQRPDELHHAINRPVAVYGDWVLYIRPEQSLLQAVDHQTGKPAWSLPLGATRGTDASGVVIAGDTAYTGGADGVVRAIDLKKRIVTWTIDLRNDHHVRPRLPRGLLREAADGTVWEEPATRAVRAPMAIASDGMLLVATESGCLYALHDAAHPIRAAEPPEPEKPDPMKGWMPIKVGQNLPEGARLRFAPHASVLLNLPGEDRRNPLIRFTADDVWRDADLGDARSTVLIVEGYVGWRAGDRE